VQNIENTYESLCIENNDDMHIASDVFIYVGCCVQVLKCRFGSCFTKKTELRTPKMENTFFVR
jgi:hypothetical protein